MAEATASHVVIANAGGAKIVVTVVSTYTTGDVVTFSTGAAYGYKTAIVWHAAYPQSTGSLVSSDVASNVLTFGATSATVTVLTAGY